MCYDETVKSFIFKSFISYIHADGDTASWLQKALEGYRVPKHLVGSKGEFGEVPRRVAPVFRDREDLSSASDLSGKVKEALEASETLIVVCSPSARKSEWVSEEVRYFHELGRSNRIHAVIVDGDPTSKDPSEQCFPAALVEAPDGSILEPLAADARKWADGRLLAKLKVVSGILGIPLDALRRRDMQRRQRLWMASMTGTLAITVIMAVLAITAITARNAAENRREHAEELVGYMVGDLKTKLDEVGRLDILEGMGGRVSEYLESLDPNEVTDESLNQQAQVWRQLGEVAMDQGQLEDALKAFNTSRDVIAELSRRNPDNPDYIYELGNAEFWVGYVYLELGDFDKAQRSMDAYLDQANTLVAIDPSKPAWLMEKSYAHSNMAAMIIRQGQGDMELALQEIEEAAELNRQVMELAPDEPAYRSEYGETLAWLADTQLLDCRLGEALIARQKSVEIARGQMEQDPANVNLSDRYARTLSGLGSVALQVGMVEMAIENYGESGRILGRLSELEPSNLTVRSDYLAREFWIGLAMAEIGQEEPGLQRAASIRSPYRALLEEESWSNLDRRIFWVNIHLKLSDLEWLAGRKDRAARLLAEAEIQLEELIGQGHGSDPFTDELIFARFLHWQQTGRDLYQSAPFDTIAAGYDEGDRRCSAKVNLFRQAILSGEQAQARKLAGQLLDTGYYDPVFIRECRQYGVCPSED